MKKIIFTLTLLLFSVTASLNTTYASEEGDLSITFTVTDPNGLLNKDEDEEILETEKTNDFTKKKTSNTKKIEKKTPFLETGSISSFFVSIIGGSLIGLGFGIIVGTKLKKKGA